MDSNNVKNKNVGNQYYETQGKVGVVEYYTKDNVPYPLDKTKIILKEVKQ